MAVAHVRAAARSHISRLEEGLDAAARGAAVRAEALRVRRGGEDFAAFELCRGRPGVVAGADRAWVLGMVEGGAIDRWELTDCLGSFVTGVAWRAGVIRDAQVRRWAGSGDRWLRRLALVSTVPLNCRARGAGECDAARTLAVCEGLIDDRDDMVVKALSWALRELAKRDAAAVKRFVRGHEGRLAARVQREVGNKLSTGLKNPRGGRAVRAKL